MSKTTNTSTIDAAAIAATLTPKGQEFMQAVGLGQFSFFDEGIVENSGAWGSVLSGEGFASVRSASGIMNATKKAGLWHHCPASAQDGPEAGGWWSLTAEGAAVALYLAAQAPEQPETGALPADEPVAAESPTEAAAQPEEARTDATKEWKGNYNTVFVPFAEDVAVAFPGVTVWVENVSAMLRKTHVAGANAEEFVALLGTLEELAQANLRTWQKAKASARRDLTDMLKYNQNRAFLAGFGQGVAARVLGKKKVTGEVRFAKDMERAMVGAETALAAGRAAGKEA
jgi:hypothetical protein